MKEMNVVQFMHPGTQKEFNDMDYVQDSNNPTGISFKCEQDKRKVWNALLGECVSQGFVLGVRFDEPTCQNVTNITSLEISY